MNIFTVPYIKKKKKNYKQVSTIFVSKNHIKYDPFNLMVELNNYFKMFHNTHTHTHTEIFLIYIKNKSK